MARGRGAGRSGGKYRSAITGKYVTARYGKSHPKTTVRESKLASLTVSRAGGCSSRPAPAPQPRHGRRVMNAPSSERH